MIPPSPSILPLLFDFFLTFIAIPLGVCLVMMDLGFNLFWYWTFLLIYTIAASWGSKRNIEELAEWIETKI